MAEDKGNERTALETLTDKVLDRGLGSGWQRLAPLSVGAVASSVLIVTAGGLVRRLVGARGRQFLGAVGALALVPLALWLLTEPPQPRMARRGSDAEEAERLRPADEEQTRRGLERVDG